MKAGRQLDALIAETVMGRAMVTESEFGLCWKVPLPARGSEFRSDESAPHYSTDMVAAMQLVERLADTVGFFSASMAPLADPRGVAGSGSSQASPKGIPPPSSSASPRSGR